VAAYGESATGHGGRLAALAFWRLWPFGEDGLLAMNHVAKMAGNEVGEEN
jgi:hypothetical protein